MNEKFEARILALELATIGIVKGLTAQDKYIPFLQEAQARARQEGRLLLVAALDRQIQLVPHLLLHNTDTELLFRLWLQDLKVES